MKIQIVDPSMGAGDGRQYAASFLVDDVLAIDAGCIGYLSPFDAQRRIGHVFLSHSHVDHIGSLPLFLDNVYEPRPACPTVYGSESVLNCLKTDLFNDRVWPDLTRLSQEETPFLRMETLENRKPIAVHNLKIMPVALEHTVPTMGFVIESREVAVATVYDTMPTNEIWEVINAKEHLKAVFLEASLPNSMDWLARKAKHLTPSLLQAELKKLKRRVRVIAVQMKPAFHETIVEELESLGLDNLEIGAPGKIYEF